ncbi:MAG: creatininase family protein [Bryobacterales bacterium]|nr:creatininase family protein [Bryobacterales bacterium]
MFLSNMTWPKVRDLDRGLPVVIPIAAVEQHGHHLPVATDSMLLGEVVRRAEKELPEGALFAPLQWLGNSMHHIDFTGSMSASPRVYLDLLQDMAEPFLRYGFRRILYLNGHGGNVIPAKQAIFEMRQRLRDQDDLVLLFSSYWNLADPQDGTLTQPEIGHAGEWETSMMLRIAPHLVAENPRTLQSVSPALGFEPAYRGWTTRERSETGHIGSPELATEEKGEHLLAAFAAGVVSFLERMRTEDSRILA